MFERVDPFIGTEATSLPPPQRPRDDVVVAEAAGRQHAPGRDVPARHGQRVRVLGRLPDGLRPLRPGHRGRCRRRSTTGRWPAASRTSSSRARARSASTTTTSASRRCCSRSTTSGAAVGHRRRDARSRGTTRRRSTAGIRAEITVGPKSAVHRYTFPRAPRRAAGHRLLARRPVHPARPDGAAAGAPALDQPGDRAGRDRRRGCAAGRPRRVRRPALAADALVRPPAHAGRHAARLRPDPPDDAAAVRADVGGPVGARAGGGAAVRVLAARRRPGAGEPRARVRAGPVRASRPARGDRTEGVAQALGKIRVDTPSKDKQTVFSTALYHSLIKPCLAPDESPFWPADGPFAFDIATMWDIYRTQLPLLTTLLPDKAVELANALLYISRGGGQPPDRVPDGARRRPVQPAGVARWRTRSSPTCASSGCPGMDWDWALVHMHNDLRRTYGEDFLLRGEAHPISHTLDLAFGYWCTSQVARARRRPGARRRSSRRSPRAGSTRSTRRPGLLQDSTYYEGGRWNYSFRLLHDMAARIKLSGGDDALRRAARPVLRLRRAARRASPGVRPGIEEMAAGYALEPVRGPEQRAGHGGAVVVPLRRPARPHRRGGAGHRAEPVRHRPRRAAGQRRLRRAVVVVRVGVARALPGRRPEPVPHQRARVARSRASTSATGNLTIETTGFVEPTPDGPTQYVQSVAPRRRAARPHLAAPATSCIAAAACSSSSARAERLGHHRPARRPSARHAAPTTALRR